MAGGKYEGFSILMLNKMFNGATWTIPTTFYLALFSVTPSISSTGTEATGSGYARLSIASNSTNWPVISGSTTTITNNVTQTMATATGDWSSAANQVAAGLWDSSSAGILYYWGPLTESKPVLSGDSAFFAGGSALTVQET